MLTLQRVDRLDQRHGSMDKGVYSQVLQAVLWHTCTQTCVIKGSWNQAVLALIGSRYRAGTGSSKKERESVVDTAGGLEHWCFHVPRCDTVLLFSRTHWHGFAFNHEDWDGAKTLSSCFLCSAGGRTATDWLYDFGWRLRCSPDWLEFEPHL